MASSIYRHLIILLAFCSCTALADAQEKSKPLANSELLALVAGNALNENVVHEIESGSLAFRPSDEYCSQLSAAASTISWVRETRPCLARGISSPSWKSNTARTTPSSSPH